MLSGLAVACWLAAAPARPAPARPPPAPALVAAEPFAWRVPGLVDELEVPGEMNVGGMPIRLRVYTSRESIPTLLQSFATAAEAAGYYLQHRTPRLARQPHLTALDTRTFTAYTLLLEPAPGGRTSVVVGEARMGQVKALPPGEAPLPVHPGATQLLQSDFEGARTLAYHTSAPAPAVRAWYREQLGKAGYTEEQPLVFLRREQQVRLSLQSWGGGTSVLLFLETAPPTLPLSTTP